MTDYYTSQQIQIIQYRFQEWYNFLNIQIAQDSNGFYIVLWQNIPGWSIPPTPTQVDAMATDPVYLTNYYTYQRQNGPYAYHPLQKQLSMLYDDLKNDGHTWTDHIGSVEYVHYPLDGVPKSLPNIAPIATDDEIPSVPTNTAADKKIVLASMTGNQSISNVNKNTVSLTENVDAANNFSSNTFTAPSNGYYSVNAFIQVDNAAIISLLNVYSWQLFLTQTGSVSNSFLIDGYNHAILGAVAARLQGTKIIPMNTGDTLVLQVQKSLATALNIYNGYFNIFKISDL